MYPNELQEFIKIHNFELGNEDLLKAISIKENPQLNHIEFSPYNNIYNMWDRYGNHYEFKAKKYIKKKE